jgi:hypothetical protein
MMQSDASIKGSLSTCRAGDNVALTTSKHLINFNLIKTKMATKDLLLMQIKIHLYCEQHTSFGIGH